MKQGPSFATKQGTVIALACAAAFALPQAVHAADGFATQLRADGHPLTLQGNVSLGYARSKTSGLGAGDVPEHGNVWSGESNVRFSASAAYGGGFIQGMGFQVESGFETSDGSVSASQGTLASRNSGIGLKTSIGTLWFGKWDTPMKIVISQYQLTASPQGLGASTTGWYGTPGIGGGSFTGVAVATACASSTGTCTTTPALLGNAVPTSGAVPSSAVASTMNFRRRQANTVNFYTPNINGFQAGFQWGPDEAGSVNVPSGVSPFTGLAAQSAAMAKPTMWGGNVGYWNGPFSVAVAYEKHEDYLWGAAVGTKLGAAAAPVGGTTGAGVGSSSSDHAVNIGASYQAGPVQLSAFWERLSYSQSGTTGTGAATNLQSIEGSKYYLGARWTISGPHALMGAYGKAGSLSCGGTAAFQAASTCNNTGAQFYLAHYRYQLDKVTYINVTYSKTANDSNGNFVGTNNAGANGNGHTDAGWSVGVNTSF